MARRTDFQAAITYTGQKIKGEVTISYKIDGVRILHRPLESEPFNNYHQFVTRNNKVPPGLDRACTTAAKVKMSVYKDCEIFLGSFIESNSPLQKHEPVYHSIRCEHIYPLDYSGDEHKLDDRLFIAKVTNPCPDMIAAMLEEAVSLGYEGLVIRAPNRWYRVKPVATADVRITGWFEQLDKNKNPKGILGGFNTNYGKVTAFTEEMRIKFWDNPEQYIGQLINCQYKERYHTGKFRYAVKFLNLVTDKDHESFDTEPPEK